MPVHSSIINVISSPWMLLAPSIPLLLILLLKTKFDSPLISILIYSIVSFLIRSITLINDELSNNLNLIRFVYCLDFLFSFIILFNCISQKKLKHPFITALLVYTAIACSFFKLSKNPEEHFFIMEMGIILNFILAGTILITYIMQANENLLKYANFWYVSGVFINHGVTSLLFLSPEDLNESESFQIRFISMIDYIIFFMIITIGIIIHVLNENPLYLSNRSSKKDVVANLKNKNIPKKKLPVKPYSSKNW